MSITAAGSVATTWNDGRLRVAPLIDRMYSPCVGWAVRPDGRTSIVYHQIGEELFLELFPGGDGNPVPGPDVTGVNHLSLTVADIDKAEKDLAAIGIPLMQPRNNARGIDGNRGMWIADPDGHRIEIMEMAPDCIQYRAVTNHQAGGKPHVLTLG